jgi:hypothetical protein
MRVWPNDLDFNLHVNNGRYLALADIGRMHWFARTGLLGVARSRKAYPVVGDAIAKFRRDLKAFQSFEIYTRLIGWDSKWGFLEHRFVLRSGVSSKDQPAPSSPESFWSILVTREHRRGCRNGPLGLLRAAICLLSCCGKKSARPLHFRTSRP